MTERFFSLEYSAPRTNEALERLKKTHNRLNKLKPHFCSVTYGAGGSTKEGTQQAILALSSGSAPMAPHLSSGSEPLSAIDELLKTYRSAGVSRLVALRGDQPSGILGSNTMTHANELVRYVRETTGDHFHIDVAAYPEIHPESETVESEIYYFKAKVEAGADSAITQYFYNPDSYFRFRDLCQKAGVNVPIVPGIMPITNYEGLIRFSSLCGAEIPRWLDKNLKSLKHDKDSLRAFGADVVSDMCQRLLDHDAPGLHFYTLNQAMPTLRIWNNLRLS
jgi:methylenetetrahydrofolate reductase (NADPH)